MKSLIMASGFGTRLYPLTRSTPKALLEYKGKPLISHIVGKIPQDIDIMVNVNKKFEEDFRRWQGGLDRKVTLCVEPVYSEEQSFGALGSLIYWIKEKSITDDLLVIASDNYFEFSLSDFIAFHDGKHTLVAIHEIADRSKACQFGVVELNGEIITHFEEKPSQPKTNLVSSACWILPQRVFPMLFEFCGKGVKDNLGTFISYLVDRDKVRAYVFNEQWFDIGSQ